MRLEFVSILLSMIQWIDVNKFCTVFFADNFSSH